MQARYSIRLASSMAFQAPMADHLQSESYSKPVSMIDNSVIKSIEKIAAEHPGLNKNAVLDTYAQQFTSERKNSAAGKFGQRWQVNPACN